MILTLHAYQRQLVKDSRKEVVDFIGWEPFDHNYSNRGHEIDDCFACKWESKLKEWGIKQ